jgi:hypothetical protein
LSHEEKLREELISDVEVQTEPLKNPKLFRFSQVSCATQYKSLDISGSSRSDELKSRLAMKKSGRSRFSLEYRIQ